MNRSCSCQVFIVFCFTSAVRRPSSPPPRTSSIENEKISVGQRRQVNVCECIRRNLCILLCYSMLLRMYGFSGMKAPRNIIGCRVLIFPIFSVHSSQKNERNIDPKAMFEPFEISDSACRRFGAQRFHCRMEMHAHCRLYSTSISQSVGESCYAILI